jgi:hypothetical protein
MMGVVFLLLIMGRRLEYEYTQVDYISEGAVTKSKENSYLEPAGESSQNQGEWQLYRPRNGAGYVQGKAEDGLISCHGHRKLTGWQVVRTFEPTEENMSHAAIKLQVN